MKKLVLAIASMLLISVTAATAQSSDTTKTSTGTTGTSGVSGSQGSGSNQAIGNKKDLVRIQSSEVPASLRKTLEDPMYAGWENSTIYRNKSNNEYVVEIRPTGVGASTTTVKTYRFDKNGKPVIDDK